MRPTTAASPPINDMYERVYYAFSSPVLFLILNATDPQRHANLSQRYLRINNNSINININNNAI